MQSITWEAVRGLFPAPFKSKAANVAAIKAIWDQYHSGAISQEEARAQILQFVMDKTGRTEQEIFTPEWFNSPSEAQSETSYEMVDAIPKAPRAPRKDSGINVKVAPNPDIIKGGGRKLASRWNELSQEDRMSITRNVGTPIIKQVMAKFGVKDFDLEFTVGSYEGDSNPSINIHFGPLTDYATQIRIAHALGIILRQKQMITYDETDSVNGTQIEFVKVVSADGLTYIDAVELFAKINSAYPETKGYTFRDGALIIGNFDGVEGFHDAIDAVLTED